jgi:hypothetical protein
MHMYLFQENLRYDKLAEGLGARGEYVRTPEQFKAALARSYKIAANEGVVTIINVPGAQGVHVGARLSAGRLVEPRARLRRGRALIGICPAWTPLLRGSGVLSLDDQ